MGGRSGLSKIEVVVLIVIIAIGVVIFSVIISNSVKPGGRYLKDVSQLRGIHQSWLIFSNEFEGVFPIPGVIRRLPVMQDGVETIIPGRGEEDITQNTTANLYGACITQNYFSPELCVGPNEPSGNVFVHDTYNWDLYDPLDNVYWDDSFAADLDEGSNVSFAHMPMAGGRRAIGWRESLNEKFAILGNRGPRDGIANPQSLTYQIYDPPDKWVGNIIFNDNHAVLMETFTTDSGDNVFRDEEEYGDQDAFLTFTKAMTPEGPVVQWD